MWKDKISNEQKKADLDSVNMTESWEVTVLKEARPDWVDPDDDEAFFGKDPIQEVGGKGTTAKGKGKK